MTKFKVGDRVRIANKRGAMWNHDGKMDKWMNKIMTIRSCPRPGAYRMVEDQNENSRRGWVWSEEDLSLLPSSKILITTEGKTTLARLYEGDKVVKRAEAKCSPKDTFDFNTGANLAYSRLMFGTDYHPSEVAIKPEDKLWKSRRRWMAVFKKWDKRLYRDLSECLIPLVKRPAKVGEYIVVVLDGYQPEPEFKPHLLSDGDNYGEVGEETNYIDAVGRKLYVGDVVELFRDGESRGLRCVVKPIKPTCCRHGGKRFVMGIESDCNDKDGTIKSYQVLKSRGFETLKHGEVIKGIEYRGEAQ